jgi:hypothetical protein
MKGRSCRAALKWWTDLHPFSITFLDLNTNVICLKSWTAVVKSWTNRATNFVHDLTTKVRQLLRFQNASPVDRAAARGGFDMRFVHCASSSGAEICPRFTSHTWIPIHDLSAINCHSLARSAILVQRDTGQDAWHVRSTPTLTLALRAEHYSNRCARGLLCSYGPPIGFG